MKILNLNTSRPLNTTEKLIRATLTKDINAFKATNKQFLRNNRVYYPLFMGLIA
jgi:hypothetical protein